MSTRTPLHRATGLLLVAGSLVACSSESHSMAFVERLGADTIAVEKYTRTDSTIDGQIIIRSPVTQVATYRAELTPEGGVQRLVTRWETPSENPGGPDAFQTDLSVRGDSAYIVVTGGANPRREALPAPEGVTFPEVGRVPYSLGLFDQMVRSALRSGEDRFEFSVLQASANPISQVYLARHGADSLAIDFFGNPMYASFGEDGGLTGRTGMATTFKVVSEPVDAGALDIETLAAEYAARDARGQGLGVTSPTDTVSVAAGGADFSVVYSRPSKRGRTIWGELVPWNEIWRTGANFATHFTTNRELEIAGERLPAGVYTLFTTFTEEMGTLIVNGQTGQWGTIYDESRDLFRVEMERVPLGSPVEQFTISIETADGGPRLQMAWGDARYQVAMGVR